MLSRLTDLLRIWGTVIFLPFSDKVEEIDLSRLNRFRKVKSILFGLTILFGILIFSGSIFIFTENTVANLSERSEPEDSGPKFNVALYTIPNPNGFSETLTGEISIEQPLEGNCIKAIYVEVKVKNWRSNDEGELVKFPVEDKFSVPCNQKETTSLEGTRRLTEPLIFQLEEELWYGDYPFVGHDIIVTLWTEVENEFVRVEFNRINFIFPEWQVEADMFTNSVPLNDENQIARQIEFHLQRRPSLQILTIVLLIATFVFILLLATISDTGSALEVSVGILLGLWGIQEILIPTNIENTTPVHEAILFLYLLFASVALFRFVVKPFISFDPAAIEKERSDTSETEMRLAVPTVQESTYFEPTPEANQNSWNKLLLFFVALLSFMIGLFLKRNQK